MAKFLVFRFAVVIITLALYTLPSCEARPGRRFTRSQCSQAVHGQEIGPEEAPPPGKTVCVNCLVDIDIDGREYYRNCVTWDNCPQELISKVNKVKNGEATAIGDQQKIVAIDNENHYYSAVAVLTKQLDGNFAMGSGEGDRVLTLCRNCDAKVYDNGILAWHCKEAKCPDEFKDNFSWTPFKSVVSVVPIVTCVHPGNDHKNNAYYCYNGI